MSKPKDFVLAERTTLSEQLTVLHENLATESGWKQDVSNTLESQGRRFSVGPDVVDRLSD
ncbi:hypothetical protein AAC978_09445 [Desulfitobacterium sp. THU1]|uniref:hypothetical protein n=1 Tax=Desulfitobacterium sp. THU1 TaxID=3138072 RepID=UPI0031204EAC